MAIIVGLIGCLLVGADLTSQSRFDRPALVVVEDDTDPARIYRTATAYTYDSAGHVLSLIEASGFVGDSLFVRSIAATYDASGRVTLEISELGNGETAAVRDTAKWSYDSKGRASGVFRIHEALQFRSIFVTFTSFAYDDSDRLVQQLESVDVDADGSVDGAQRTIHFYSSGQRVRTLIGVHVPPEAEFSAGRLIAYDYDDQQRLIRQRDYNILPDGTPSGAFDRRITYDSGGHPVEESYAEDVDLNGELESITTTTRTYNTFGDLTAEHTVTDLASTRRDEETSAFTYDEQKRLVKREIMTRCESLRHSTITYFY